MAILLYIIVSVSISIICHFKISNYFSAVLVSALILDFGFHVSNFFSEGYVDPFVIISFIIGFVVFFMISLVCGLPVVYARSRKSAGDNSEE
jgi:hypothetical protein